MNNYWQTKTLPRTSQGQESQTVRDKGHLELASGVPGLRLRISFICWKSYYLKRFAAHHQGSQLKPATARETHPGQQWFPLSAKWTCVRFPGMAPQRKQHLFTKPNHITQMGRTRRSSKAEHNHHRNFLIFLWNPEQKKQM